MKFTKKEINLIILGYSDVYQDYCKMLRERNKSRYWTYRAQMFLDKCKKWQKILLKIDKTLAFKPLKTKYFIMKQHEEWKLKHPENKGI